MVPGMSERERLAVGMQRTEWLAGAVPGPRPPAGRAAMPFRTRHIVSPSSCRRELTTARVLVQRVCLIWRESVTPRRKATAGRLIA